MSKMPFPQAFFIGFFTALYTLFILSLLSIIFYHWLPFIGEFDKKYYMEYIIGWSIVFCIFLEITMKQIWGNYIRGSFRRILVGRPSSFFEPWRTWVHDSHLPVLSLILTGSSTIFSIFLYIITAVLTNNPGFLLSLFQNLAILSATIFFWNLLIAPPLRYLQNKRNINY